MEAGAEGNAKGDVHNAQGDMEALVALQNCMAGRIDDMIMLDVDEIRKSYQPFESQIESN